MTDDADDGNAGRTCVAPRATHTHSFALSSPSRIARQEPAPTESAKHTARNKIEKKTHHHRSKAPKRAAASPTRADLSSDPTFVVQVPEITSYPPSVSSGVRRKEGRNEQASSEDPQDTARKDGRSTMELQARKIVWSVDGNCRGESERRSDVRIIIIEGIAIIMSSSRQDQNADRAELSSSTVQSSV